MEINKSKDPAAAAGEHISNYINAQGRQVLCLLAGGSALKIVDYIKLTSEQKRRTIFIMGDERVGEASDNNYYQLQTQFPEFTNNNTVIDTRNLPGENPRNFASRISDQIKKIFLDQKTVTTVVVLGMGSDGHTAGIFPLPADQFSEVYKEDTTYVPVCLKSLTIDSRASITPSWLLKCDELIGYVSGIEKTAILNKLLHEKHEINDMPAQILKLHRNSYIYTDLKV